MHACAHRVKSLNKSNQPDQLTITHRCYNGTGFFFLSILVSLVFIDVHTHTKLNTQRSQCTLIRKPILTEEISIRKLLKNKRNNDDDDDGDEERKKEERKEKKKTIKRKLAYKKKIVVSLCAYMNTVEKNSLHILTS